MKNNKFTKKRFKAFYYFQELDFTKEIIFNKRTLKDTNVSEIAKKLKQSERTIWRLIKLYKECEKKSDFTSFIFHKNKNKPAWNKIDQSIKDEYTNQYEAREKFYQEQLKSCIFYPNQFIYECKMKGDLIISESTIRRALNNKCILSPLAKNKTKKLYKKNQNNISDENRKAMNQIAICYSIQNFKQKYNFFLGRVVETDACFFDPCNFGFNVAIGAIVDSTGLMLAADCELQETNTLYASIFNQMFYKYGIPETVITDCRRTFYNPDIHNKTDFTLSLEKLGIQVISSSAPTAKPNVERAWGSLQIWIRTELVNAGIKTFEEFKKFCKNELPKRYNERFNKTKYEDNKIAFKEINHNDIPLIFTKTIERKVNKWGHIKIDNEIYIAKKEDGTKYNLTSDFVNIHIRLSDNIMYIRSGSTDYYLEKTNIHIKSVEEKQSEEILRLKREIVMLKKNIHFYESYYGKK